MVAHDEQRYIQLAVDRATDGLDDRESRELDRYLDDHPHSKAADYELAAAAVHLAFLKASSPPMPAAFADKLEAEAHRFLGGRGDTDTDHRVPQESEAPFQAHAPTSGSFLARPATGWLAAAAVLLVSVALFVTSRGRDSLDVLALRRALLQQPDVVVASWAGTDDPLAGGVSGDVVWRDATQTGYMRFANLAPNDPGKNQYQLWIFDGDRRPNPVDGGVFDVTGEDVVVPIDAKLAVTEATLFAITLEKPGGVVVSEKERLVLTAAP